MIKKYENLDYLSSKSGFPGTAWRPQCRRGKPFHQQLPRLRGDHWADVTEINVNMNLAENQSIGVIITTTEQVGKKDFQISVHQVYLYFVTRLIGLA